jgi:hypothetical protein
MLSPPRRRPRRRLLKSYAWPSTILVDELDARILECLSDRNVIWRVASPICSAGRIHPLIAGFESKREPRNAADVPIFFDGRTRRRSYRFFSVALGVLRRAACAAGVRFDALANSADCVAAALVRRTPGCSPFVNSTPAASSARCSASIVDCFASAPFSMRVTVFAVTPAFLASSRTPQPTAARAIRS